MTNTPYFDRHDDDEWRCPNCDIWNDEYDFECTVCGCPNPENHAPIPVTTEPIMSDNACDIVRYVSIEVVQRHDNGMYFARVFWTQPENIDIIAESQNLDIGRVQRSYDDFSEWVDAWDEAMRIANALSKRGEI